MRSAADPNGLGPQLITYADRLGGDIPGLERLLDGPFAGAFDGVHVLPFFDPFDGTDAGFDPRDHANVDPRLGTWADVAAIAERRAVMADLIVNHVSADSDQFRHVRAHGEDSPWSGMFLTLSSVFPQGATEAELAAIYRPRPGLPFTAMTLGNRRRLVWTTFTSDQVDLDVRDPKAWEYLTSVVDALVAGGVSLIRLDAVGYVGKAAGTDCFMTPESYAFMDRIQAYVHECGAQVLLEVHGHHLQVREIADRVDLVYDFQLPPLVLHALTAADPEPLARWLTLRPRNTVTVLDTHDGIGVVDVGTSDLKPGVPGLLTPEQIDTLVEGIHERSRGGSRAATGAAASNLDLYQVNCTFYDALGRDDRRHLLARLVQLFVPGIPQVYYTGLLAGENDLDLLRRSGVGRDVNRHHYTPEEIARAVERPVVRATLDALRLRASEPAFGGTFSWRVDGTRVELAWTRDERVCALALDTADASFRVTRGPAGAVAGGAGVELLMDQDVVATVV